MAKQDYYDLLGVEKSATEADLKKAFRKKAMKYHPDKNPGDHEAEVKFKEIGEAYDALKDPQKRAAYDQYGHAAFEGGGPGGSGNPFGGGGMGGGSFSDVFEDLFGDFMGGGQGQSRGGAQRGGDLRYNLNVSLEDAFSGSETTISVPTSVECGTCTGTGAEPGTQPQVCGTCNGHGKIRAQQGFFVVERTCTTCRGAGHVIASPCGDCRGQGRKQKDKTLVVNIPAGVEDGMRIRLSGEGEAGFQGGPAGDLYIFVTIEPHDIFKRDQTRLYLSCPIPMTTAILGGEIEVPTIDGKRARLKIPEGTQAGAQFRLRKKGMPQVNSPNVGDMIVEARVETPVNLSKDQQMLIRQFAEEAGDNISPASEGFFSKVKDLFGAD